MRPPTDTTVFRSGEPMGMAIAIDEHGTYLTLPESLRAAQSGTSLKAEQSSQKASQKTSQKASENAALRGPWRFRRSNGSEVTVHTITANIGPFVTIQLGDSSRPWPLATATGNLGQPLISFSNHAGTAASLGQPGVSFGQLSAFVTLPDDLPTVPGRRGQAVSEYRGVLWEISNAVTYGASGGPVLDAHGRVVAITTLAQAPERRVGSAIPLTTVAEALSLPIKHDTIGTPTYLQQYQTSLGTLALQRPQGLGNPRTLPRPAEVRPDLPDYQQQQQMRAWERYLHQQQVLWRDHPVPAVAIDPHRLATASDHLHGDVKQGYFIGENNEKPMLCRLENVYHGIAVFRCSEPHGLQPITTWASSPTRGGGVSILAPSRYVDGITVQSGVISSDWRRLGTTPWLQIDARINYGNLGGLVLFRDDDGNTVPLGIAVGVAPSYPWLTGSGVGFVAPGVDLAASLQPAEAEPGKKEDNDQDSDNTDNSDNNEK